MAVVLVLSLLTRPAVTIFSAAAPGSQATETFQGRVLEILSEERVAPSAGGGEAITQRLSVEITRGERQGHVLEVEHGGILIMAESRRVEPGDRVLVGVTSDVTGERYYIADFVRTPQLGLIVLLFAVATLLVGRQVGLRSLLSMGYSALMILLFILPRLGAGRDPVSVCVVGSLLAMVPALYLTYGWGAKTHSAVTGLAISLLATWAMAAAFVDWGRLTGFSTDEAAYLVALSPTPIDLRGLVLGGIIIGTLGVLDDVCVGQASATFELKRVNPSLGWRPLFRHGMTIGRDHIASMVNTLMMAYVGAALPLLLLAVNANASLFESLNRELLAEEIIRTLAGSLGLILAVPITSAIASLVAQLWTTRVAGPHDGTGATVGLP
jgi:uncharacterized membrane protein